MTDWKEYAHLFTNGKFKVSAEYYTKIENDTWDIVGFYCGELMLEKDKYGKDFDHCQLSPNDCTLIARPIEDMTDEEWKEANKKGLAGWNGREYNLVNVYETLLYLLSIGVYPFDQSHFEDGTVIDATKGQED